MTNQQILTKAIEKAIAGGWDGLTNGMIYLVCMQEYRVGADVIFDKAFAKALWGDDPEEHNMIDGTSILNMIHLKVWQVHLACMVLADDPIAYLGEHL